MLGPPQVATDFIVGKCGIVQMEKVVESRQKRIISIYGALF